jgi:hypothetical protein
MKRQLTKRMVLSASMLLGLAVLAAWYREPFAVLYQQWSMNRSWGDRSVGEHARYLLQQPIRGSSYFGTPLSSVLFDIVRQRPPESPLVFQIHEMALADAPVTLEFPDQTNLEQALAKLFEATKCTFRAYDMPGDVSLLTLELERPGARQRVGVMDNATWPSGERVVVEKSHICRGHCPICSPSHHQMVPGE